jgi:hypothetical protein
MKAINVSLDAKTIIIIILTLALAFCIFLLLHRNAGDGFGGKISNKDAIENIGKYRNSISINPKTKVIWYDSATIRAYLDTAFYPIRSALTGDPTCKTCKWVVGFYFAKEKIAGSQRTDFYVIPTYVDTVTGIPRDFFDQNHRGVYTRKILGSFDDDSIAYNTGHLWP